MDAERHAGALKQGVDTITRSLLTKLQESGISLRKGYVRWNEPPSPAAQCPYMHLSIKNADLLSHVRFSREQVERSAEVLTEDVAMLVATVISDFARGGKGYAQPFIQ
jgi:hypothetical protein